MRGPPFAPLSLRAFKSSLFDHMRECASIDASGTPGARGQFRPTQIGGNCRKPSLRRSAGERLRALELLLRGSYGEHGAGRLSARPSRGCAPDDELQNVPPVVGMITRSMSSTSRIHHQTSHTPVLTALITGIPVILLATSARSLSTSLFT